MNVASEHVIRKNSLLPLQHHGHSNPSRCADGDEAVLLSGALQLVADGGDDAGAGGAEGMSEGDGAAGAVDGGWIDLAYRLVAPEFFLRDFFRTDPLDVRQHLRGEGFVHLDDADLFQRNLGAV